jgi:hypothetical protein
VGKEEGEKIMRFGKTKLARYIDVKMTCLEEKYRFDSNNGWAQVEGKPEDVQRAYGQYWAFQEMVEEFDLDRGA